MMGYKGKYIHQAVIITFDRAVCYLFGKRTSRGYDRTMRVKRKLPYDIGWIGWMDVTQINSTGYGVRSKM